jgi:hypothetical protein
MSEGSPTLTSVFSSIDRVVATMAEASDPQQVEYCMRLVQGAVARLPHKYLPAATYPELHTTEKLIRREGRSRGDCRLLRSTLMALFDQLVLDGALRWHPLRGEDKKTANPVVLPTAGLAVALPPARVETIAALVKPLGFTLHSEPSAMAALDRAAWFPFSFVVCAFPCESPVWFLDSLRGSSTLCRTAGIVLVADSDHVEQAQAYLGRGANRVVALNDLGNHLAEIISELDQVSERVRLRIPVQIERQRSKKVERWRCENISRTGMLLATSSSLRVGAVVDLLFQPPSTQRPIRVSARVVRKTTFGREEAMGYGVCFLGFYGDGQYRLERFLQ